MANIISILIQATDQSSKTMDGVADSFQSGMKKVAAVTGVAGVALTAFSKGSVDYLKDVVSSSKTLATQTGMTIEKSSQLVAAMQHVGLSGDTAAAAFRTFSKNIADSRDNAATNASKVAEMSNKIEAAKIEVAKYTTEITKNGDASGTLHNKIDALNLQIRGYQKNISESTNTLDKLNVSTVDAQGKNKDFSAILLDVADKFKAMPDGAEKTAAALDLFGRSGASMIKILNNGSDGIKDLEDRAKKLGLTLTNQNIGAINDYIKSQKDLADSTNAVKIQVGTLTAPILTNFNQILNDTITSLMGADSPMKTVTADVLAFGGPVLGAVSGVAAFAGNIASAMPLVEGFTGSIRAATATTTVFQALAASPVVMGGIATAGVLADIALVYYAVKSVVDAISAMNDAAASKAGAIKAQQDRISSDKQLLASGTSDQKTRALSDLQKAGALSQVMNVPSFSSGGFTGNGSPNDIGGVVHKGEYVLPQSMVDQNTGTPKAMGGISIGNMTVVLQNEAAGRGFLDSLNNDSLLASKGLSVRQGA